MPSLDELLDVKLETAVRKVLEERLRPIEEQLARLTPATQKPPDDEEEISLAAAKRLSGYSVDTLRRWIRVGKLAAKKGAKEWRVRRGDLKRATGRSSGHLSVVDIRSKAEKILAGGRK